MVGLSFRSFSTSLWKSGVIELSSSVNWVIPHQTTVTRCDNRFSINVFWIYTNYYIILYVTNIWGLFIYIYIKLFIQTTQQVNSTTLSLCQAVSWPKLGLFGMACDSWLPRRFFFDGKIIEVPSGNLTKSYWKWPFIVSFPIKTGDFP